MIGRSSDRTTGWEVRQGGGGSVASKKLLVAGKCPWFSWQGYCILDFIFLYYFYSPLPLSQTFSKGLIPPWLGFLLIKAALTVQSTLGLSGRFEFKFQSQDHLR